MERTSKKKISLIETLSENITYKINKYLKKDGIDLIKMNLGLKILLINISKFTIVLLLAATLHLFMEAILIILVFSLLRRNAFGLHAKSSIVCTICCIGMFVGGAYLSHYIKLNNLDIIIIHTLILILVYKYSPADTEAHPLIGSKQRFKLKKVQSYVVYFL